MWFSGYYFNFPHGATVFKSNYIEIARGLSLFTFSMLYHHLRLALPIAIEIKYRLLKVCYVPAISATFLFHFFGVATNEKNKAGGTCH